MEIIDNHKEILVELPKISGSAVCDVGLVRKNNEDNLVLRQLWTDNYMLAVAIDGVGGQEGGEVAAAIAAESIPRFLETYSNGDPLELLSQAVQQANNDIFARREQDPKLAYMSCVLTAAIIDSRRNIVYMAHVGDTRLYVFDDNGLRKLSHDHSLVGYREEQGDLSEEEAMHHPQRNIISRDVGSEYHETTEFVEAAAFPLYGKSILLLCSDGLCDMITSSEMSIILASSSSLDSRCGELVNAALKAGGRDNVTVLLVEHTSDKKNEHTQKTIPEDEMSEQTIENNQNVMDFACSHEKKESTIIGCKRKYIMIAAVVISIGVGIIAGLLIANMRTGHSAEVVKDSTGIIPESAWSNQYVSDKTIVEEYNTANGLCNGSVNVMSLSQVAELFEYTCFNSIKNDLPDSLAAVALKHDVIYDSLVYQGEQVWCECVKMQENEKSILFQVRLLSNQGVAAHGKCTFGIIKNK